ncbi:CC181 protein, partial [Pitta sordida]|nr:CC181 protein [Pitta sordida]
HTTEMSDKEDRGDPADTGDLTENGEYEDDFEKDLTDEEENENLGRKENPEENEEDIVAPRLKAADSFEEDNEEIEESLDQLSEADTNAKVRYSSEEILESRSDTRQEDCGSDTGGESSIQESKLESQEELDEKEDEEIKRYVLEKIEEANKQLENQSPVDQNRERKLKFKDELVDLAVSPLEDAGVCKTNLVGRDDVSSGLSQLHISNDTEQESTSHPPCAGTDEEAADGKILVEKAGKFELLSLCDIESQGFLPPISVSFTDIETRHVSPKSSHYSSCRTVSQMKKMPPVRGGSHSAGAEERVCFPQHHPNSAVNVEKGPGKQKNPQRAQSACVPVKSSTYCLSPRQKELRKQIELKNEKLRKEEEERKREQEEQKRRENEMVFRAWLQKKKEQVQEEKRIRRAKQLEELNIISKERNRDPEEAYNLWLEKKHRQHMKERQIQLLRRQAEEMAFFPSKEDCDRAFKEWLRRKREEKRAAELAAKERARQLRLEARRAKRMRNIQCI